MLAFVIIASSVVVVIAVTVIWFLPAMGWGFFRPINNVEAVVLRGDVLDHTVRENIDYYAEKAEEDIFAKVVKIAKDGAKTVKKKLTTRKGEMYVDPRPAESLLYQWFGIRYFGLPFIYRIGRVKVNYPPQLKSISGRSHTSDDTSPGFTVHRNYLVVIEDVDFQGGLNLTIRLNLEVRLKQAFVAWGRNDKFLDPLGQCLEGAVKGWAMGINATDFIGMTAKNPVAGQALVPVVSSKELRHEMCAKCLDLNNNTNTRGGTAKVRLETLCGYEIVSVSYNDYEPGNEESQTRIDKLEEQNQAIIETVTAEQKKLTAIINADAAAVTFKTPAMAQVEVDKAAGLADAVVMEAKKNAVGAEIIIAELNAHAFEHTKVSTLIIGGGNGTNGLPSFILPLPGASPQPAKAAPAPAPATPAPATPAPAKPATP